MSVLKFCFKNIQTLNLTFSYGLTGDLTTFPISQKGWFPCIKFCISEPGGNAISVPPGTVFMRFSRKLF